MKTPVNNSQNYNKLVSLLETTSTPLNTGDDLDPLIDHIGDAKYVLLGEASHGTHEYYTWRAKITQRLIQEKGFSLVAVEGEWPDCYSLNRYAKGLNYGIDIQTVMSDFLRWPTWMWANWETAAFIDWLKNFNQNLPIKNKVGFYGLDVYSFKESLQAIIQWLEKNDPDSLHLATDVQKCFEPYNKDEGIAYARASSMTANLCEEEVYQLLATIRNKRPANAVDDEEMLSVEQNAHILRNAEKYYRAMIKPGPESWNIRDRHMVDTLDRLTKFYGSQAKVIVWEHNTHIGDARATTMAEKGMVNVGQLLRERYSRQGVVSLGFGSYSGRVIAGKDWGDDMREIDVPAAMEGSWEHSFHLAAEGENRLLLLNKIKNNPALASFIAHRAIGVVYNPVFEKYGNYVPTILPERYDAFIFLDQTKALHPIHIRPDGNLIPETYPFGM